jgi:XapX domain-containing protein
LTSVKTYLLSLLAGLLVGAIYALLGVRSPAPPAIALVGLLGMLLGEQAFAAGRRLVSGQPLTRAWVAAECIPKVTGLPRPGNEALTPNAASAAPPTSSSIPNKER